MPQIYALLVGINEYMAVTPLNGCVADIKSIESILTKRVAEEALQLQVLHDAAATRAAIIDGFTSHLAQATADDIALFYFCGHGSQEPAPPEWHALDGEMNQTVLSVDARHDGVFDIADKELSTLIHDVGANGAQVIVILDSCHSGGATRSGDDEPSDGVERMTGATKTLRTLDDYLPRTRELYSAERLQDAGPPTPSHIAISACQHDETAKEVPLALPRRGAFTQSFEQVLSTLGPSATYQDLVRAIGIRVRDVAKAQQPMIKAYGKADAATLFLGGAVGRRQLTVTVDKKGAAWLSAGAPHGVAALADGHRTDVAIYARGTLTDSAVSPEPLARAVVDLVEADRARLALAGGAPTLDPTQIYVGVITAITPPALQVVVSGDDAATVSTVRSAVTARSGEYTVVDAPVATMPAITVRIAGGSADIVDFSGRSMRHGTAAKAPLDIETITTEISDLARWHGTRDRVAPGSSFNDQVVIEIVPVAEGQKVVPPDAAAAPVANGTVTLTYVADKGPRLRLRLRNKSATDLYVVLVDLSQAYECAVWFSNWISAGDTAFPQDNRTFRLTVNDRDAAARMSTDVLKVFVATAPFDASGFVVPSEPKRSASDDATRGGLVLEAETDDSFWGTSALRLTVQR